MTDTGYAWHADLLRRHIEAVPQYDLFVHLLPPDQLEMILQSAGRFAQEILVPINRTGDRQGCSLTEGRVVTAPGYVAAWQKFVEQGWHNFDHPSEYGGQELPWFLNFACREMFDRACMAFGMVSGPPTGAGLVLSAFAPPELRDEWLQGLADGRYGAAMGISEADAGSDVGRIRTQAKPEPDGSWSITGEKMWTSFGDHDMVERVGIFVLARTPDAPVGTRGLSLFLVPTFISDDEGGLRRNTIVVRRIEEKLGLHGSPTCQMGYDAAKGWLIGERHRGLPQMFLMLQYMRFVVATEGVGMAFGAAQTALRYAYERQQGGDPARPPVAISNHADIRRQLLGMFARIETLRGLLLEVLTRTDVSRLGLGERDEDSAALCQWMLPILKACGAETGYQVADDAIQVLGGAGYTREWPIEQWLRDARMSTIGEGSTGIQALDLLQRKLYKDNGKGLNAFLAVARREIGDTDVPLERAALRTLDRLESMALSLLQAGSAREDSEPGATAFLRFAALAATGWIAVRLARLKGDDKATLHIAACGRYWLSGLDAQTDLQEKLLKAGWEPLQEFHSLSF